MSESGSNYKRDRLFSAPKESMDAFRFDETVTEVFHDMIQRSVPGYSTILPFIGLIAAEYAQKNSTIYDLGCSLGAATLSIRHQVETSGCNIMAVDNSKAMVSRCEENLAKDNGAMPVSVHCEDVQETEISNASVVVLNLVMQFIDIEERLLLLKEICNGLNPGGVLILSEKLRFDDSDEDQLQTNFHHAFKRAQGYSDLEISQKRSALENVLIPESLEKHLDRLKEAGFSQAFSWFQCFNFSSIIAIK
ncbi:MAG: carboxy-S-adenosyl-L-methionine synthase CmoA [Mariprofundaceae bacterium]